MELHKKTFFLLSWNLFWPEIIVSIFSAFMKSEKTVSRKSQKFRSAFHFLEIKQKSGNVNIFKFNFCVSSLLLTWSFSLKRRSFQGFAARKGKFMMIDKGQRISKNNLKVKNILFWRPDKRYSGCVWPKRIVEHLDDKYHADKYSVPTPLLCAYQPPLAPPTLPRLERPGYKSVSYFSTQTG